LPDRDAQLVDQRLLHIHSPAVPIPSRAEFPRGMETQRGCIKQVVPCATRFDDWCTGRVIPAQTSPASQSSGQGTPIPESHESRTQVPEHLLISPRTWISGERKSERIRRCHELFPRVDGRLHLQMASRSALFRRMSDDPPDPWPSQGPQPSNPRQRPS
jgi:hypothetical protein